MADWTKPLPGEAVEGADGHVDDHNALNAAVQEIRDYVDSGALKGAKGEPGKDGKDLSSELSALTARVKALEDAGTGA